MVTAAEESEHAKHVRAQSMLEKANKDNTNLHLRVEELEEELAKCEELHTLANNSAAIIQDVRDEAAAQIQEQCTRMAQAHASALLDAQQRATEREEKLFRQRREAEGLARELQHKVREKETLIAELQRKLDARERENAGQAGRVAQLEETLRSQVAVVAEQGEQLRKAQKAAAERSENAKVSQAQIDLALSDAKALRRRANELAVVNEGHVEEIANLRAVIAEVKATREDLSAKLGLELKASSLFRDKAEELQSERQDMQTQIEALILRNEELSAKLGEDAGPAGGVTESTAFLTALADTPTSATEDLNPKFRAFVELRRELKEAQADLKLLRSGRAPPPPCEVCEMLKQKSKPLPVLMPPQSPSTKRKSRRKGGGDGEAARRRHRKTKGALDDGASSYDSDEDDVRNYDSKLVLAIEGGSSDGRGSVAAAVLARKSPGDFNKHGSSPGTAPQFLIDDGNGGRASNTSQADIFNNLSRPRSTEPRSSRTPVDRERSGSSAAILARLSGNSPAPLPAIGVTGGGVR